MRMLSGEEAPDAGTRTEGHQVVMQYFAQDEATRLDPALTVYETLAAGSPMHMVPTIRNILGGFLFSGDDVYKKVRVLSGGERTRLAVARMLLRPSNTLLLDEPTNHLDLDSKDVLLDALEDYGGTLIFVSHDRYFVERLATKIIEVGGGRRVVYPGTYEEFLWSKEARAQGRRGGEPSRITAAAAPRAPKAHGAGGQSQLGRSREAGRHPKPQAVRPAAPAPVEPERAVAANAPTTKKKRATPTPRASVEGGQARRRDRRARGAHRRARTGHPRLEQAMAAPASTTTARPPQPVIDRHQALMWEVGDLMHQWERCKPQASPSRPDRTPT